MKKTSTMYEKSDSPDDCNSEILVLRQKLAVKTEALRMLSQELDKCRTQRDQLKLMAEQIQERYIHLKKQTSETRSMSRSYGLTDDFTTLDSLMETREQNKCLRLQVETLRQKLSDALADIKVLRSCNNSCNESLEPEDAPAVHQREEMIEQLEKLNVKCAQLQSDLQTVLDEKHELETERDAFKCKAHRLNHELSRALSATKPMDIDALVNENRYLQERLGQLMEEKELSMQSLSKYKSMLDSKRVKGTIKLGGNAAGTIMTHKQVEQLLQQGSQVPPQKSAAAVSDLHGVCAALLEALNDKTLALAHQKKANKILATRICELDSAVQSPTSKLLEGYSANDIDTGEEEIDALDISWSIEDDKTLDSKSNENEQEATEQSQELKTIPNGLPKNLSAMVQRALLNLKENKKEKH